MNKEEPTKKIYEEPETEIVAAGLEDIIMASTVGELDGNAETQDWEEGEA